MRIGVLCSRIRAEEKLLFGAFANRGLEIEKDFAFANVMGSSVAAIPPGMQVR